MSKINTYKGIVTGAASGIGKAVALELAQRGAVVYLVDVDSTKLDQLVQEGSNWHKMHPYVMDVADPVE